MTDSIKTTNDSSLHLATLVFCVLIAAVVVATRRIEIAILMVGALSLLAFAKEKRFWVGWSLAVVAMLITLSSIASGRKGGETLSGLFSEPFSPWLAACGVLILQALLQLQRSFRKSQDLPQNGSPQNHHAIQPLVSDLDSQMTFDLQVDSNGGCESGLHQIHDTNIQETDSSQLSLTEHVAQFSLGATEIENVIDSIRTAGDFDEVQIRLIDDSLKRAVFTRMSVDEALPAGSVVGGYSILRLLNQGGGGRVYVAKQIDGDQIVALKVLKSQKLNSRFRREMSLVQKLAHPNIVVAYEVNEHNGVPFIAMELMAGADLHAHVRDNGAVSYRQSLNWMLQASRALEHADERGLTHRDVKPGNFILHHDNLLKLTDLGLAVLHSKQTDSVSDGITREAAVIGTLQFMAPEQAKSLASADARSDIFGLGATWYYLLEGKAHLQGSTMKEQLSALLVERSFLPLTDGLVCQPAREVLKKMLAYDPNDRFQSWAEVIEALLALLEDSDSNPSPSIEVLLVEDNEDDVVLTTRLLSELNHSVLIHEATTLAEARCLIDQGTHFDLILLDLHLPDSSGLETVHSLRKLDALTPLVVLSGYDDLLIGEECIAAGANAFARKSDLNVHELERTIFVTRSRFEASAVESGDAITNAALTD